MTKSNSRWDQLEDYGWSSQLSSQSHQIKAWTFSSTSRYKVIAIAYSQIHCPSALTFSWVARACFAFISIIRTWNSPKLLFPNTLLAVATTSIANKFNTYWRERYRLRPRLTIASLYFICILRSNLLHAFVVGNRAALCYYSWQWREAPAPYISSSSLIPRVLYIVAAYTLEALFSNCWSGALDSDFSLVVVMAIANSSNQISLLWKLIPSSRPRWVWFMRV